MAQRTGRRMRQNETIRDYSGLTYRIEALLGEGGFGRAYLASRMSRDGKRPTRTVCLKDCGLAANWHGEAFLGKLLADQPEVVRLIDAFVGVAGVPETRRQFLIFEYMEEGTVDDWLENSKPGAPWAEHRVRKEVRRLLLLLAKMHSVGITHRDIKPANVYLRNGRLRGCRVPDSILYNGPRRTQVARHLRARPAFELPSEGYDLTPDASRSSAATHVDISQGVQGF